MSVRQGLVNATPGISRRLCDRPARCRSAIALLLSSAPWPMPESAAPSVAEDVCGSAHPRRLASNWASDERHRRPRPPARNGASPRRPKFPLVPGIGPESCRGPFSLSGEVGVGPGENLLLGQRRPPVQAAATREHHGVSPGASPKRSRRAGRDGHTAGDVIQPEPRPASPGDLARSADWPCPVPGVVGVGPCQDLLDSDRPVPVDPVPIELQAGTRASGRTAKRTFSAKRLPVPAYDIRRPEFDTSLPAGETPVPSPASASSDAGSPPRPRTPWGT